MSNSTRIFGILLFAIAGLLGFNARSQSVMDPNDPVITYNPATPPTQPAYGQIGKWIRSKRLNWNTDSYKAYIYKGSPYRLKFPKTYDPAANDGKTYPMIIMFHGLGEPGAVTDNEYQLYHGGEIHRNAVDNGTFDGYVFFMQTQGGYWGESHYTAITEIIDYMAVNNKLDPFRVNIHGLSAGGQAVWKLAQDYPTYIASLLPMSAASVFYKEAAVVNKLKFTPNWLFQGGDDGAPAPATSVQVRDAMVAGGANFTYTQYPGVGHGTWYVAYAEPDFFPFMLRAHKANPWALYGRTEFCPGDPINITLGVTAGFNGYQWRKDGVIISGATSNQINVTTVGTYDCRVLRGSLWSPWSPTPAVVLIKGQTVSPEIKVTGLFSKVLPALDSSSTVNLEVPAGYTSYLWQRVGSSTTLSTTRFLTGATPGDYRIRVTEQFGCSSDFSAPYTVINANGPNKPDAPINLVVTTLSKTSLKLDWSDNPSPAFNETGFEIYQSAQENSGYKLIAITAPDVLNYTVTGLTSNTKLYYKLRAINNTSASAASNTANGTTATDSQAPSSPSNLIISGSSRTSISLSWDAATDDVGVTQYDIYINGVKSYVTPNNSFIVYGLETGRAYNFSVKAKDFANNYSPFSNQVTGQALLKGLNYKYYTFEGTWEALPDFNTLTPLSTGTTPNVILEPRNQNDNFAFLWEGFINIPVSGVYTFRTNSDDGSKLYLAAYSHSATALVNNDGLHGGQDRDGTITLTAGTYPIAITFYEQGGGESMSVSWRTPGNANFVPIPDDAFSDAPVALPGNPPLSPASLTATAQSFNSINLSWADNSNNESAFEIWRASGSSAFTTVATLPANTTTFTDAQLTPETQYFYRVRAINQYGESSFNQAGASGINYEYYELNNLSVLPDFNTLVPKKAGVNPAVGLGMQDRGDNFQLKFSGYINIPTSGTYTFYTSSDDGSALFIDGFAPANRVVNNDGLHGNEERSGSITLSQGFHSIYVTFFEAGGGEVLTASIAGPGISKQQIPASMLFLDPGVNATTFALPPAPFTPSNLLAKGISTSAIQIDWEYNDTETTTVDVPGSTIKIEAEAFTAMNGIVVEGSSEGTPNLGYIDAGDWMDYSVNMPSAGMATFNFRIAAPGSAGQLQIRDVQGTVLGSLNIPATGNWQVYTTTPVQVSLPAGQQTIRIHVAAGGWNFNWFELVTPASTTSTSVITEAASFNLYRSNNNNSNFVLLASVPGTERSYIDSSLFANSVYYYKISASNEGGVSADSNEDSAATGNNAPVLTALENQNMRFGTQLQLAIDATDADSEPLTFEFPNLPGFGSFASTSNGKGILTFQPSSAATQGTYENIIVRVFDQRGDSAEVLFNLVVNDNYLPVIGSVNNVTLNELQTTQVNISATDQNPGTVLTWSISGLPGFAVLTGTGNARQIALTPGYADNGAYPISIRVEDGVGGFDTSSFVITVNNVNPNRKTFINFNVGNNAAAPWNNTDKNPKPNDNFANLLDETGANSGIGLQIVSWLNNGYNTLGATSTNGIYPNPVMSGAYFGQTTNQVIRIYGLNPSYTYNFTFFGSRGGVSDNRTTNYTINGQTVSLNAAGNISNTVSLLNVAPLADGSLLLNVKNGTGSVYSYLNAMVIESIFNDGSAPARPRNLTAELVDGKASLTWVDAAYNETAYEVYKAVNPAGPFTLLNPGGNNANLQAYEDVQVLGNTTYYYTVRATNSYGNSLYSDTISLVTPNSSPLISGVADVSMKVQETNIVNITATDSPGDIVTLQVTGLPSFASFNSTGAGTGTITITPGSSTGTFEGITVTATDNNGAVSSKQFKITVTLAGVTPIYVNFNQVTPVGTPWNSFNSTPSAGLTLSGLKDNTGVTTGVGITMVESGWSPNNLGATTGNNSGVYPDNVMLTCFYHSTTARTVRVTGLDQTKKYNFTLFGSRSGAGARPVVFSVGAQSVTLDVGANTSNTAKLTNLSPNSSGVIEFTVARGAGAAYAYLNALVIEGYEGGGSPGPGSSSPILQATGKSKTSIQLNWMNSSQTQTGVQVYRSTTQNGEYTLLTTLGATATSYLNTGLALSTQYFYKVRGVISGGFTPYSNIATGATLSYQVHVNFNRQTPPAGAPWNNTNSLPQDGNLYPNLLSEANNPTGINLGVIGNTWSGENIYGSTTGNNSGIYPDNVISSTWWLDRGNTGRFKIDGLNQSMRYSFVFFASRDGGGAYADRTTDYTIGNQTVSLNAINNISNTVQINDVAPDETGSVYININAGGASPYAYMGALVVQAYSLPEQLETQAIVTSIAAQTISNATQSVLVDEMTLTETVKVDAYPNPFTDDLTLKLSLAKPVKKMTVVVADITGRILFNRDLRDIPQGTTNQRLGINGRNFAPGVYFIKVIGSENLRVSPLKVVRSR